MSDTPIQPIPEPTNFSVGQILKSGREARGFSLQDVAEKLKLTPRQLTALESDDFQSLPGNTFVRGFVRNYARFLEVDSRPLLDHLTTVLPQERVQAAMPPVSDATALNTTAYLGRQARSWSVWLMVVLGLSLGAGVVFWYLQKPATPEVAVTSTASEPAEMTEPEMAASASAQEQASGADSSPFIMRPAASSTASVPVASAATAMPVPSAVLGASRAAAASASLPAAKVASAVAAGGVIRVAVEFDSWVQIVDAEGQVLVSQLLGPGTDRSLSGKAPFKVKIGNAPKTQLYYRGQRVDLAPYARADVATLELK